MTYIFSILLSFLWSISVFSSDSDFTSSDDEWVRCDKRKRFSDRNIIPEYIYPSGAIVKYDEEEQATIVIMPNELTKSYIQKINVKEKKQNKLRDYIYRFPQREHLPIVNYINHQLNKGLEISSIVFKIKHISSATSSTDRERILDILQSYIKYQLSQFEQYDIIETLFFIDYFDHEPFLKDIKHLIKENMTSQDLIYIIKATSPIMPSERQELLEDVKPIVKENMNGKDIARVIKLVRSLDHYERTTALKDVAPLIKEGMDGKDVCRMYRMYQFI